MKNSVQSEHVFSGKRRKSSMSANTATVHLLLLLFIHESKNKKRRILWKRHLVVKNDMRQGRGEAKTHHSDWAKMNLKKRKRKNKEVHLPSKSLSFLVAQVQSDRRVFSLSIIRQETRLELNLHSHSFPFPHPEISVHLWWQCLSLVN